MKSFKIITIILLTLLLFLAACADEQSEPQVMQENNPDSIETTTAEPEREIPALDMKGKSVTVLTAGWWDAETMVITDICPDEITGEPLNDAAYDRKIKIEEKYNCAITHIPGSYEPSDDVSKLQRSVKAGDHAYDVAMMRGINFTTLLTGNYLLELGELEYIEFDNPWWNKNCSEALRIGGKRYGINGNISIREISFAALICFNKSIIQDHGLESPYDLVKSGGWTLDKFTEMAKQTARDLNGNGVMDDEDLWGLTYDRDRVWNLINSCGVKLIEIDSDGYPQIIIDEGENLYKIQNILTALFDESYSANGRRISVPFQTGRSLFRLGWAVDVVALREHDVDFGVIPLPKYNDVQAEYLPNVYGLGVPIVCVPSTVTDMDNTGLFMEAFSYEGYKSVIPVFYENILKTKSARDSESEAMIDYIFGNLHYDTGTLLNFEGFTQQICEMAETLNTNIVSFVEKNKARVEKTIQKIMDSIE